MMWAHITAGGRLVVTPSNDTEAYALKSWRDSNGAFHVDTRSQEEMDAERRAREMMNGAAQLKSQGGTR